MPCIIHICFGRKKVLNSFRMGENTNKRIFSIRQQNSVSHQEQCWVLHTIWATEPPSTQLWLWPENQILPGQAYSVIVCSLTHWGQAQPLLSPSFKTGYPWLTFNIWFCIFFFKHTSCDKWIYAVACLWKIGTTYWINAVQQGTSHWVWETDQMKRYIYSEMKISKVSQATDVAINRLTSCITRIFREACFTVLHSSTALSENTNREVWAVPGGITKGVLLNTRNIQISN